MKKLTMEEAVRLAEKVVKGKEDYVYINPRGKRAGPPEFPQCVYWDKVTDQPSCLVGQILYEFGIPKNVLIDQNDEGVDAFDDYYDEDGKVNSFLHSMQNVQDRGSTWGDSLDWAKGTVKWTE